MKVAIVDYGMGNLGSVRRALAELGAYAMIVERPEQLSEAERIILPGVGSFTDGMAQLNERGWSNELRRQTQEIGKPLLGICLGMQLLASEGSEGGNGCNTPGLDLIPGEVVRLDVLGCKQRIPHVGWNAITFQGELALFAGIPRGTDFYFVHSFTFRPTRHEDVLASADYSIPVVAAVGNAHILGAQFHPEKSSKAGFRLLKNFLEIAPC